MKIQTRTILATVIMLSVFIVSGCQKKETLIDKSSGSSVSNDSKESSASNDTKHGSELTVSIVNSSFFEGKAARWSWHEGAYAGARYRITFNADGTLTWLGVAGGEAGDSATEKAYSAQEIAPNFYLVSWHETNGTTVSVTLDTVNNNIWGIVSDNDTWIQLAGEIEEIKSIDNATPIPENAESASVVSDSVKNGDYFKNKSASWSWKEGEYAGAKYKVTFNSDGTLTWLGVEGGEAGDTATEKAYSEMKIGTHLYLISWHETNGTTVTVILDAASNNIWGNVSDNTTWIPLKGVVDEIVAN